MESSAGMDATADVWTDGQHGDGRTAEDFFSDEPMKNLSAPVRPCVPITMRSM